MQCTGQKKKKRTRAVFSLAACCHVSLEIRFSGADEQLKVQVKVMGSWSMLAEVFNNSDFRARWIAAMPWVCFHFSDVHQAATTLLEFISLLELSLGGWKSLVTTVLEEA
jgi:hypothetical protein